MDHENELLITTLKAFMDAEIFPYEDEVDAKGEVPIDLGRQIEARAKDVGLFAANLPTEIGGGGLGYQAMALMEREYGKTTHALQSWIARPTEILLACEGDQKEQYLLPCVKGEKRELFALTEPEAGSDVMGMKSNAVKDGDDWILNGSKHFISGPIMPDFAIVFAATGEDQTPRGPRKRITAFLVDVGLEGVALLEVWLVGEWGLESLHREDLDLVVVADRDPLATRRELDDLAVIDLQLLEGAEIFHEDVHEADPGLEGHEEDVAIWVE